MLGVGSWVLDVEISSPRGTGLRPEASATARVTWRGGLLDLAGVEPDGGDHHKGGTQAAQDDMAANFVLNVNVAQMGDQGSEQDGP